MGVRNVCSDLTLMFDTGVLLKCSYAPLEVPGLPRAPNGCAGMPLVRAHGWRCWITGPRRGGSGVELREHVSGIAIGKVLPLRRGPVIAIRL